MKNSIYLLLIIMSITMSCSDDFLEQANPNQISNEKFWSSKSDALYALTGCYDVLQSGALYGGGVYASGIRDHDCLSDNSFNSWKWQGFAFLTEGAIDPSHWFISNFWNTNYKGVVRCNQVIHYVGLSEFLSDDEKKQFVAEARFLRGLYYFNLANSFGDVPLILVPQTVEEAYVSKNTKAEVYEALINDLKFAAESLEDNDFARVDKGAALAMLAKAYLYDAQFDKAATAAEDCIALNQYELFNDYAALFTEENEENKGIVFSVRFSTGLGDNNGESFSGTWKKVPQTHHQPMKNFVNDFYCIDGLPINQSPLYDDGNIKANRDPRLDPTILFDGDVWIDGEPAFKYKPNRDKTGFMMQKYIRRTSEDMGDGGQDFYVIRYADVLLMRAEALIESNTLGQEVYDRINEVRSRVGMPSVESVEGAALSKDQLRDVLRHERRVEFGLEGTRYYDLKRWDILDEAVTRALNDNVSGDLRIYEGEKSMVWPLPQGEVDNNYNLDQNPLWE